MDELVVHVGPPKTATTEIQETLKQMQPALEEQGILLDLPAGMAAHIQLAYALGSGGKWERNREGWFAGDPESALFPRRAAMGRQLITAEALYDVPSAGAVELMEWSGANSLLVVAGVREPIRWLWSYWQQLCKSPGRPQWSEFVQRMTESRLFFPSSLISPWASLGPKARFTFFEIDRPRSPGPVREFLRAIGYELNSEGLPVTVGGALNKSMGPIEAILSGLLADEIAYDIKERSWVLWGDIPDGFVGRSCVDLMDKARPMYELGAWYGRETAGTACEPLFDHETADALSAYRALWIEDAVASSANSVLTEEGRGALENCAMRYGKSAAFEGFQGPWGSGFPRNNVVDFVELPGYFQPMVRSLSTAIALTYKATHPTSSERRQPGSSAEDGTS